MLNQVPDAFLITVPLVVVYVSIGFYFFKRLEEPFEKVISEKGISYGWGNFVLGMVILLWPLFLAILIATTAYTAMEGIAPK